MTYTDAKGRPELVVNRAIKLGLAFFTPVTPADDASVTATAAQRSRRAVPAAAVQERSVRRAPARRSVSTGNAARSAAVGRPGASIDPQSGQLSTASGRETSTTAPKRSGRDAGGIATPRRRGKRKAGGTPTG